MAVIKDSGTRREFPSGSVRDMAEGKGRFDLCPLYECARFMSIGDNQDEYMAGQIIYDLEDFVKTGNFSRAVHALQSFCTIKRWSKARLLLEVSHHYEDGARKYGEYNWQKGIPIPSYLDSAIRHMLKDLEGMDDERHDRAFAWNVLSMMYQKKKENEENEARSGETQSTT